MTLNYFMWQGFCQSHHTGTEWREEPLVPYRTGETLSPLQDRTGEPLVPYRTGEPLSPLQDRLQDRGPLVPYRTGETLVPYRTGEPLQDRGATSPYRTVR